MIADLFYDKLVIVEFFCDFTGHSASIRHSDDEPETEARFEMIEIPLKGDPTCIAIGPSLGGIGVGMGDCLLIYGYVMKAVAGTDFTYR